jgi:hypothetical protein
MGGFHGGRLAHHFGRHRGFAAYGFDDSCGPYWQYPAQEWPWACTW